MAFFLASKMKAKYSRGRITFPAKRFTRGFRARICTNTPFSTLSQPVLPQQQQSNLIRRLPEDMC